MMGGSERSEEKEEEEEEQQWWLQLQAILLTKKGHTWSSSQRPFNNLGCNAGERHHRRRSVMPFRASR